MKPSDQVQTPEYIWSYLKNEFGELHDPCPINYTINALSPAYQWPNNQPIYINPPYSEARKWVRKAWHLSKQGKTVIILLPIRQTTLSTSYFTDYIIGQAEVRVFPYEITFKGFDTGAKFSSALIIYNGKNQGLLTSVQ